MWLSVAWAPLFLDFKFWHHTFSCGNKTKCPFICWWHGYIYIFIIRHEVHLCGVWQVFKCQLEAFFKNIPLYFSWEISLWPPRPLYYGDSIFRNMHLILSFLSFYFLCYLHCHCACQYKRGNCSQMIFGWYLTLSCLCLVCSATFLTISLPSCFASLFLMHWHYSWALSVMSLITDVIINKKPTICLNHANMFSSHIKQFAASLRTALAAPFSFSHLPT